MFLLVNVVSISKDTEHTIVELLTFSPHAPVCTTQQNDRCILQGFNQHQTVHGYTYALAFVLF